LVDQFILAVRVVLSLAVVLGIMWALARLARKAAPTVQGSFEVVQRTPVGRRSSVMVMRVGEDRGIVIGVTDQTITHLADVCLPSAQAPSRRESIDELSGVTTRDALRGLGIDSVDYPVAEQPAPPINQQEKSPLQGSILSPSTWRQARLALTERTVRR
jgi:flagellar protein FliO/FliZ